MKKVWFIMGVMLIVVGLIVGALSFSNAVTAGLFLITGGYLLVMHSIWDWWMILPSTRKDFSLVGMLLFAMGFWSLLFAQKELHLMRRVGLIQTLSILCFSLILLIGGVLLVMVPVVVRFIHHRRLKI